MAHEKKTAAFNTLRCLLAGVIAAGCVLPAAPQPVKLRLAANLCTSMTGAVLASQNVPPLTSTAQAAASANDAQVVRLQKQRDDYFALLDGLAPFSGVYLSGSAAGSGSGNGRYSFGVELELYNRGREESRRRLERARSDNKAQYLQLLRDTEQRQLKENLLAIEQMRNRLFALLYEREQPPTCWSTRRRRS
jgi:hypothetical protein